MTCLVSSIADLQPLHRRLVPALIRELIHLILALGILRTTARHLLLILRRAVHILGRYGSLTVRLIRRDIPARSGRWCRSVGGCCLCRGGAGGILYQHSALILTLSFEMYTYHHVTRGTA